MSDEPLLRVKARETVEQRKLPNRHPDRLWRGPGVGAPYAMCVDMYHLHVRCYSAWELVRTKVDGHPPS